MHFGKRVFISYSREDRDVATLAAKLLRAGGAAVFQDVVDIEYGADWKQALKDADPLGFFEPPEALVPAGLGATRQAPSP